MSERGQLIRIGERCRTARTKLGLSQAEVAYRVREHLPEAEGAPSDQKIARLEAGDRVTGLIDLVAALSLVYNRPFAKLAPELVDDFIRRRELMRVVDIRSSESAGNAGSVTLRAQVVSDSVRKAPDGDYAECALAAS